MVYSKRFLNIFRAYTLDHSKCANKILHWIGFTLVLISIFGLFSVLRLDLGSIHLDFGICILLAMFSGYSIFDLKSALLFLLLGTPLYFLGHFLSSAVLLTLWGAGWISQSLGHALFEKRSPTATMALRFALYAPLLLIPDIIETAFPGKISSPAR